MADTVESLTAQIDNKQQEIDQLVEVMKTASDEDKRLIRAEKTVLDARLNILDERLNMVLTNNQSNQGKSSTCVCVCLC